MLDEKLLVYPTQLGTGYSTLYTVTAPRTKAVIREITLSNVTALDVRASVSLVPSGGGAGVTNSIVPNMLIPANKLIVIDGHWPLTVGDFIAALAASAASINLTISGVERTP